MKDFISNFSFFPGDSSKNQNDFEYDQEIKIGKKDANINQENLNFLSNHDDSIRRTDQGDNETFEVEAILDYQTNVKYTWQFFALFIFRKKARKKIPICCKKMKKYEKCFSSNILNTSR